MEDPALVNSYSSSIPTDNYMIYDKYKHHPNSSLTNELLRANETVEVVNLPSCSSQNRNSRRSIDDDDDDSLDEVRTLTSEDLNNLTQELSNYFDEAPSHESKSGTESSQINELCFTEPCSSSFYSQLSSVSDNADNADNADKMEEIEVKFRSDEYKGRVITGPIAEHVARICVQHPRIRIQDIQSDLTSKFGPERGKVSKNNLARFITRYNLRDTQACRIKLDKEMEAALVQWRREDESMSAIKLKRKLELTFPDRPKISTNRIYYLLRSYGIGKFVSNQYESAQPEPPSNEEELKNMRFTGYVIDQEIGEYIGQMCLNEPDLTYKQMSERLVERFGYRANISSHGLSDFVKRHRLKAQHAREVEKIEVEVEQAILELYRLNPRISWHQLALTVNRRFQARRRRTINSAYVVRVMTKHGHRKAPKSPPQSPTRPHHNPVPHSSVIHRPSVHKPVPESSIVPRLPVDNGNKKTKKKAPPLLVVREGESVTIDSSCSKKAFPCTLCDCSKRNSTDLKCRKQLH